MRSSRPWHTCLLSIALALPLQAQTASFCGDCNGDGAISILDALTASQHSAGLALVTGTQFVDCNPRGVLGGPAAPGAVVDILDALAMAQAAAGIPVTFDCETAPSCAIRSPAMGATTGGDATLTFDALDLDEDIQTVTWEFSTDGGVTFSLMSVAPGSAILTNPAAVAPGAALTFEWDSDTDLVTPGGLMAYLPWGGNPAGSAGQMSVIDVESQQTFPAPPFTQNGASTGIRVSEELGIVALSGAQSSVLWVVDLRTGLEIAAVPLALGGGALSPRGVAIDPAGRRAFVAHSFGGLSEVDLVTMSETAFVSIPGMPVPQGIEYDPVMQNVYLSSAGTDAILHVDVSGPMTFVGAVSSGLGASASTCGTDIDPGNRLYVADFQTCRLLVWDISTAAPTFRSAHPVSLGGIEGYEVDLAPGGETLYLTQEDDTVFRFDVSGAGDPVELGYFDFDSSRDIANVDVAADGRVFVVDGLFAAGQDLVTELSADLSIVANTYTTPSQVTDFFGDWLATAPAHQVVLRLSTDDGMSVAQCTVDPVTIEARPLCSGLTLPAGPLSGVVPIDVDVTDHSVEMVTVTYQYDTGAGFVPMTAAAGQNPIVVAAGHSPTSLPPFSWDSLADVPASTTNVKIRALVEDGAGHQDFAGCLVTRDVN